MDKKNSSRAIQDLLNLAKKCINIGGYHRAIPYYDQVIELDSKCADAYYCKGRAYLNLLRFSDASECIKQAIELDPHCYEYTNTLRLVEESQQHYLLGDSGEIPV